MKRSIALPILAFSLVALAACNQATNTLSSSSPNGSAAASARASASVAASAPASASSSASSKYIDLQVAVPQPNMNAGVDGIGWTVDVIAKGNGPAMDKVKPAFQSSSSSATGKNANFPGLVVLLKPASGSSGASGASSSANLAKLFQVIGLPNTLASGTNISSVGTNASSSPAASSASSASASPAGSAATRSTATDTDTAEATWFVQSATWGKDIDVELTVFVVDGDAPDTVTNMNDLKIVSNTVTVTFHINGGAGNAPGSSARPSGSTAPSGSTTPSTAPGGASPSPSASATP